MSDIISFSEKSGKIKQNHIFTLWRNVGRKMSVNNGHINKTMWQWSDTMLNVVLYLRHVYY